MKKSIVRAVSLAITLIMLVTLFSACGSKTSTGDEKNAVEQPKTETKEETQKEVKEEAKELRIGAQAWMLGKFKIQEAAEQFEKDNPGVKVTINKVDNADTTSYILQWSQGNTNCDIALGGSREQAVQYAAKDFIINFDEGFYDDKIKKEDFFPSFLELGNIEGTQYMIPLMGEVMFLVVNKNLMKNAGLVDENGDVIPPKTWEELYEYAKRATIKEGGKTVQTGLSIDWGTNFMAYTYFACLQGLRGNLYEPDGKTIDFSSNEAKSLLEMWRKLVNDGYTPTDSFADMDAGRSNFKAGKVAMHISAHSRWVEAGDLLGADNVTVLPIPGTDKNGTLSYIHGMVIPKVSPAQDLAKKFIKERLLDKDFMQYTINKYGKMSPLNTHYQNLLASEWNIVVDATKKAATPPLYKDYARMDKSMQVEFQKCISGKQSVDDTLENMRKLMESIDLTTGLNN